MRTAGGPGGPHAPTGWAALAALAGVLWPVSCGGCGAPDTPLCRPCARPLREHGGRRAALAGTTAPGAPATWAAAAYEGAVRAAVVAWKDHGRADLGRWMAPALAEAVLGALAQGEGLSTQPAVGPGPGPGPGGRRGTPGVLLVPVPSRRSAVRERGRDAVGDLARGAAVLLRRRGAPVVVVGALRSGRGLRDQVGLDAASRADNAASSLRVVDPRVRGARVLVVDDVVTTGATLSEAARVLRAEGAVVVGAAAVAATQRRSRPSGSGGAARAAAAEPPG